jgi:hypothetical protein
MHGRAPALALTVAMMLAPTAARANPFHLQASVGTDAPLAISLRGDVELPGRLRAMVSGGVAPQAYLNVFNNVIAASGQSGAGLFGIRVESASAWRLHAGWRPFSGAGLVLMAGYGRLDLSGSVSARELITSVTGTAPPPNIPEANGVYDVASALHMFDAELGWEFLLFNDHLVIQTAVGVGATVAAHTTIQPRFASTTPGAAAARAQAQDQVDHTLRTYGVVPTLSLSLGYRFF